MSTATCVRVRQERRARGFAALAALLLFVVPAHGQSITFDFEDGTDQGFGAGFGDDASRTFPVLSIGGSNQMEVLRTGAFQEASRGTGNPLDGQYLAMDAASLDEANYLISYDWYVDTSSGNYGSFLQLGTYVNTGSGYYAQNFPGVGKEVELNNVQLASGSIFSGTVSQTFSQKGFNIPDGETFFRLGLIVNGDGPQAKVYFDNITIRPVVDVPEPTSLALLAAAIPAGCWLLRRRLVRR